MFDRDFYRFFMGFIAIIAVAFGVLIWAGYSQRSAPNVDNVASPQ